MYRLYCRIYQGILWLASFILPWRKPELLSGENSLLRLPGLIKEKGISSVLIVTDAGIASLGLMDGLLAGLDDAGIRYAGYDKTVPNPTIGNIEEAAGVYRENGCEAIIAFGGGSPMDCAKGVGARIARPNKTISQMRGLLKVRKRIPTLFAIPTTAGTGSETTLAAVITDSTTHEKYAINDMSLIPHYAVLDPVLTVNLPPRLTATTGLDALTHAVEAYIGKGNTGETKRAAREATALIFENLYEAYTNGQNMTARENMQRASYLAGIAFTRAYVGNVHAIAHTLGGLYGVPHGLANAVILPHMLRYYGKAVYKPLAELAELVGLTNPGDTGEKKARAFIHAIEDMNERMDIPGKIKGIKEEDISVMAERAYHEANPLYPVPRILSKRELQDVIEIIRER